MSKNIYHFFVEGEGERAVIKYIKNRFSMYSSRKSGCI